MSELVLLLRAKGRAVRNRLRAFRRESLLKVAVVGVAGLTFWGGIFGASLHGFRFIDTFLGSPEVLLETLLGLFFLLLGVMLLFSNAIISFGGLFRSDETDLLLTWPVRAEQVYVYKLVEAVTFSSWAFVVLGLPLLMGYGIVAGAPWHYPLLTLAYFGAFVVLMASAGGAVAVVLAAYLPERVKRVLGVSVVGVLAVTLSLTVWVHGAARARGAFLESWLPRTLGRMSFARNLFLPSHWVNRGLMEGARGNLGEAAYWFVLLASTAAVVFLAGRGLASRLLRVGWSRARSLPGGGRGAWRGQWLLARWAPAVRVLVAKDWRLFVRDPVQWSQCAILFGLMGFYVLNLRTFSYHVAKPLWRNLTALLNVAATSLVLATVTTRFVFPLLSLEGRRFWLLGLAPVGRRTVLWSKLAFSLTGALVVTVPLVVVSDTMLELPGATIWHHGLAIVCVCFGVSGLSVGLGAMFPNWKEQNPSKIVSGFGGTLNLLLSVAFVAAVLVLTAVPYGVRLARLGRTGPEVFYALCATGVLAAVVGLVPMQLGLRALRRLEF